MKNFFIFSFSRICLPFGKNHFSSFFPANAVIIKIEFENFTCCVINIRIEFTTLPESSSFERVLYNPLSESTTTRCDLVEIFVRSLIRVSLRFDSRVLNNDRFGIVRSLECTNPEKRKSKSKYKIGRF